MRLTTVAVALLLASGIAAAQRHKITINAETPEGQLLQQIGEESDETKKLAMLEQFATQHPKHEGVAWVYEQLVAAYAKASQPDKLFATGDKLLALDPADVESAHTCLKTALEVKRDPDLWVIEIEDRQGRHCLDDPVQ